MLPIEDSCATIEVREVSAQGMLDIRPSPIAGTWYPGDRERLAQSIDRQLQECDVIPIPGELVGVVAPHAGHRYSGHVAAQAFQCLKGMAPDIVAVVSPLHYPLPNQVITTAHDAYGTPLGTVDVDHALLDQFEVELAKHEGLDVAHILNDSEHSLEI